MSKTDKDGLFTMKAIGFITSRDDEARIELFDQFRDGLKQVKRYSHIHVFWWADQSSTASRKKLVTRPPYAHNKEFGVFACRAEYRPNPIMVTVCNIKSMDEQNGTIIIDGIDAFDQTPVMDIKPYIPVCDRVEKVTVPESHKNWPVWYDVEFDPTDPDFESTGESSGDANEEYPKTGRIGRLAKVILAQSDSKTVKKIFYDWQQYKSKMTKQAGSEWVEVVVKRLEEQVGEEKAQKIMYLCGEICYDSVDMLKKVSKELGSKKLTIKEFIDNQNKKFGKYTKYTLAEDGAIILEQFNCQCMIKNAKKRFAKDTYCQCSIGCREKFFSVALGRKVRIQLLESWSASGTSCKFKVIL